MFSFQPNGELVFVAPTTSEACQIHHDPITNNHASMESNLINFGSEVTNFEPARQRQRESKKELDERKVVHREVEKRRRQEMSTLHASLGSLLPLSHIKGKRSVGDQIGEAVKHIKEKKKKIEKLKIRRDELNKSFAPSDPNLSSSSAIDGFVTVNMAEDGMEILVSTKKERSDLGLSRLLAVLVERQLDVVSCVSTRTNKDTFLHRVKIENTDMRNVDVLELQDRLRDVIN